VRLSFLVALYLIEGRYWLVVTAPNEILTALDVSLLVESNGIESPSSKQSAPESITE
jgi:hypothetical protein